MNRAEVTRALAACEALAGELRRALAADAEAEYLEQGTAATWRTDGVTVSTVTTRDTVQVEDEAKLLEWVKQRHPTEVEVVERVRPAWLTSFLAAAAKRGDACTEDGEVVPGLVFVPGGEFKTVSVRPTGETRARLAYVAREIAEGRRPLALPTLGSES